MSEPEMVTVNRRELLQLLDHVDSLVCFCSVNMPNIGRYYDGSNALWAVVHRLAGNDELADKLIAKIGREGRSASVSPAMEEVPLPGAGLGLAKDGDTL